LQYNYIAVAIGFIWKTKALTLMLQIFFVCSDSMYSYGPMKYDYGWLCHVLCW